MKKILSILLVFVLVVIFPVTNYAQSQTTTITANIAPTYTITIPANTTIYYGVTSTEIGSISISNANIEAGAHIDISASKSDLVNSNNDKIIYTLNNSSPKTEFIGFSFTDSDIAARTLSIDITSTEWNNAKSGSYLATLSFSIAYVY